MEALVYKSTGSFYLAKDALDNVWSCRIRGKMKIDGDISSTNPVVVGDRVVLQPVTEEAYAAVITAVLPRENYIIRTSPRNRFQKHIVAANLDQAVLIATISNPRTSQGFIDRFLVTAEAYHIPVLVVFNKCDTHQGKTLAAWEHQRAILEGAGYKTLSVSALEGTGMEALLEALRGKTNLFSGHSGSGKTTLINGLVPDLHLKVGALSEWSGKGQHTTTFSEMFDLPSGGRIIDTPGIKEFGIVDIGKQELSHYFPEMKRQLPYCRFNNCMHVDEPGCAVKKAVENGTVSAERYQSYLNMLESL